MVDCAATVAVGAPGISLVLVGARTLPGAHAMHPDELDVFLDTYCAHPPREWVRKGIRLYPRAKEVLVQRYLPNGVSIAASWVDLFWCEWHEVQALLTGEVENMLKKPVDREAQDGRSVGLIPGDWEKVHPTLWEYLTADTYDDGSKRLTGSLVIFPQDGLLKGLLKDADTELVLWLSARNMEELFVAFEASLTSGRAEWRKDRNAGKKRPGKPGRGG